MLPECVSSVRAAELLGICPQTIRKWRLEGRGPRFIRAGRSPKSRALYLLSDIFTWLDEHSFRSTSEETVDHLRAVAA